MKQFLAIYIGSASGSKMKKWERMDKASKKKKEAQGIEAWMSWGKKNSSCILDQGAPLGKTKKVGSRSVSSIKNTMTGYTIIEAESHEAAAKKFLNHPHFSIFPGDSVEIMECLPMP